MIAVRIIRVSTATPPAKLRQPPHVERKIDELGCTYIRFFFRIIVLGNGSHTRAVAQDCFVHIGYRTSPAMTPVQPLGAPDLTLVDLARSGTKFGRAVTVGQQMAP